jgi:hypothetical protein
MAQATYKMEPGAGGGFVAYVQIVSPILADQSGKWFVVAPENQPDPPGGKPHEYSSLWKAERAARETALRLATKVTELENPGQPTTLPPVITKHRRQR